jgi:phage shock protein E
MRAVHLSLILAIAAPPLAAASPVAKPAAQTESPMLGSPLIDFDGFAQLTQTVRPYRAKRLLPLDEFKRRAADRATLLLDARSAQAFAEGHIEGAINLPFPDFNAESLAAAIGPNRNRPILIYCNNNFRDNRRPVITKALPLALNIQTFVNLYGYGYENVWELGDAILTTDQRVGWVSAPNAPAEGRAN